MATTVDTSWAVPGAKGVVILAGRGASEPPQIRQRVEIVRIGKRDIVATDERGAEHRFRVSDVDGSGFRSAAARDAWSRHEVLVAASAPVVAHAEHHQAASRHYHELLNAVEKLRRDRTSETAAEVRDTAHALGFALLDVEDDAKKDTP